MVHYPVILIPSDIEKPVVNISAPDKPIEPQKKSLKEEAVVGALGGAIASSLISIPALLIGAAVVGIPGLAISRRERYAIASTVTGIAAIAGGVYNFKEAAYYNLTLPERRQRYEIELKQYGLALEDYERTLPDKIKEAQKKNIGKTVTYDGTGSDAQSGKSEAYFEYYLKQYFGNNILKKVTVNFYTDYPYTPDFVFIDPDTKLHIDIEIDEPYVFNSKKPIHCLWDYKQETRDNYFLSRKWLVIRFAEEQVVKQPEACCAVIAQQIYQLTGKDLEVRYFDNLIAIKRWTESEAEEMATKDYRKTYLN